MSHEDALDNVEKHNKARVAICDIDGVLRGKYLHKDKFRSVAESGFGFCNVVFGWDVADACYDNVAYTGWHTGYPDADARVDMSTYREIPWNNNVPFFLADFVDAEEQPLDVCPRSLLKRVLNEADKLGYAVMSGLEFEFFNFKETAETLAERGFYQPQPLTDGMFGYSLIRSTANQPYFQAIIDEMLQFGVPIEGLHTETGPGVYEVALSVSDALEAADRAVLFKTGLKEIAGRFGIMPSFMAKWNSRLPGCSGHIHQSLWNKNKTQNLFFDNGKMSEIFKSYIAGQMLLLPELLPFYAPTVNSYKRLVEGMWAPTKVTWGIENRTTALRAIPGSAKSTRLELRVPGADINPYLALAAAVASGLYGVKNKLELKAEPIQGNGYEARGAVVLPANLQEAALKLKKSKIAPEILGQGMVEHFVNTRLWEYRQFQQAVTDWELKRYFEII